MIIVRLGHSEAMWPNPWHLKHLLVLIGLGLGRSGDAEAFGGAGVLCGLEGEVVCGLGTGWELLLLKGWFRFKGF